MSKYIISILIIFITFIFSSASYAQEPDADSTENIKTDILYFKSESLFKCIIKLPDNYDPHKSYKLVIGLPVAFNDFKSIIDRHWAKKPDDAEGSVDFKTFAQEFSVDIGGEMHGKSDELRWISYFNSHRNLWAHEGTKEKRLNKKEVDFLETIHNFFYK